MKAYTVTLLRTQRLWDTVYWYLVQALLPGTNASQEARLNPETGTTELVYVEEEDDDEDEEVLLGRVPGDTTVLQECITASQGCLLLLVLKQHLKDLYGISDA